MHNLGLPMFNVAADLEHLR